MDKKEEKTKDQRGNIEELKKKLENCEKEKLEYLKGWQRAKADLLNYKKEEEERIEGLSKFIQEEFILELLLVLDNFELAEKETKNIKWDKTNSEIIEGFLQIKIQLLDFLRSQGVEQIKTKGEKFNPSLHEAVEQVGSESPNNISSEVVAGEKNKESDIIIEEVKKGYIINGRLLRPAKVKVVK